MVPTMDHMHTYSLRFPVESRPSGELLGYVEADSWLTACVEAGRRWGGLFKVRSGLSHYPEPIGPRTVQPDAR